jgi:hypothetical protein
VSKRPLSFTFAKTTSPSTRRARGNATILSALSTIEARAGNTRQKVIDHYRKFEDRWVAKETVRLHQRHLAQQGGRPAAPTEAPQPTAEMFAKQAAHNVQARVNKRLTKVASIKTRMTNAVTRSLEPQPLHRDFARAAHDPNPKPINTRRNRRSS